MAQHTITISDQDGGISIRVEGNSALESSAAGLVTKALVSVAKDAAALSSECPCPKCQARRDAATQASPEESKPTLH